MLGVSSKTLLSVLRLASKVFVCAFFIFNSGSHSAAQAGLELKARLLLCLQLVIAHTLCV